MKHTTNLFLRCGFLLLLGTGSVSRALPAAPRRIGIPEPPRGGRSTHGAEFDYILRFFHHWICGCGRAGGFSPL